MMLMLGNGADLGDGSLSSDECAQMGQSMGRDAPFPAHRSESGCVGGRPGTRTRMGYPTRPSNVRVYQFRQPPGCSRMILRRALVPAARLELATS